MSFAGTRVKITLRSGETYPATILQVDPSSATLHVERSDTQTRMQVRRDELQDVNIVSEGTAAAATATAGATGAAASSAPPAPSTPSVPYAQPPASASPKPRAQPASAQTPSSDKKKRAPRKKAPAVAAAAPPTAAPPTHPYMEEFDYTKSTQSFDKKKAWEEIRQSQSTQPTDPLLVQLNRRPAEPRQPMLAPDEMVLSPNEREEAPANPANAELDVLRTQLARANERQALLEALTGVQIVDGPADEYTCSLFPDTRTATAHWRAKHVAPAPLEETKACRFRMRMPSREGLSHEDAVLLSYLGPAQDADPDWVQRLPEHFQGNINVKVENAPLFEQRLQSLAQGP